MTEMPCIPSKSTLVADRAHRCDHEVWVTCHRLLVPRLDDQLLAQPDRGAHTPPCRSSQPRKNNCCATYPRCLVGISGTTPDRLALPIDMFQVCKVLAKVAMRVPGLTQTASDYAPHKGRVLHEGRDEVWFAGWPLSGKRCLHVAK